MPIFNFFLGTKTHFSPPLKLRDHYALIFYNKSCKIILLFFDLLCTRVEKILRKWTKKMSKNEIDEILLCKFDATLGNLRNFFGAQNARPYMVRGACAPINPRFRRSVPNGGFARFHVPKTGVLISGKKVLVFWGLSSVQ